MRPAAADPIEAIRQLGHAYVAFAIHNPNQFRFMFMSPHHKDETHGPADPGWRSFGALLEAVERAVAAGRFRRVTPLAAAQILWMNVHGIASALVTLPPEQWPHGPAAPDLVEQVIENGIRGLLAEPGRG
jgi:AcrR family transcriptional regulator